MSAINNLLRKTGEVHKCELYVLKTFRLLLVGIIVLNAFHSNIYATIPVENTYDVDAYNGLGRIVLEKNMVGGVNTLTQAMVSNVNMIYVILYDFVLGEDIIFPANSILVFEGGSFSGKSITFQETIIKSINNYVFRDVKLKGSIGNAEIQADWFVDYSKDCTAQLQSLINILETSNGGTIKFGNHVYTIGCLALFSKVSLVGQGQGSTIIKSNRVPVENEAVLMVAPTATLVNIENLSIVGNSGINGIGVSVAVSDVETHSDYWFQENVVSESVINRLAYKNLHIRNVYIGHCKNGVVIGNIGIRVTVDNCDIKFCSENGILNKGNDNFFTRLFIERCGFCGFKEQGSNSKLSNIKSIFNGDRDPVNSYAFDCTSDLLVNCESQDNACSGFKLNNRNMLVNCFSNRDAIGNTISPSYKESQKLVGFRIVGDDNIVESCRVTSYISSMYWKPYEEIGTNNIVDILIDSHTDFYMNPVDESKDWITDLGTFNAVNQSDLGIIPASFPLNMSKKELLPTKFVIVADFFTDGVDLRESEGNLSSFFSVDEKLVLRLSHNKDDNTLTVKVYNSDYSSEELYISTESFSHVMPIRLLYIQDGNKGFLSLCYCKKSNRRYTIVKGNKTFSYTPGYTAKCSIFTGYCMTSDVTEHTYVKRFLVGSGIKDNISIFNVNTSVNCENVFFSYDYRNQTTRGTGILKASGSTANRPTNINVGYQYFDTTIAKPIWWDGTQWIYSDGTVVR